MVLPKTLSSFSKLCSILGYPVYQLLGWFFFALQTDLTFAFCISDVDILALQFPVPHSELPFILRHIFSESICHTVSQSLPLLKKFKSPSSSTPVPPNYFLSGDRWGKMIYFTRSKYQMPTYM